MPSVVERLEEIRGFGGVPRTPGLSPERLASFEDDPALQAAVEDALRAHRELRAGPLGALLKGGEAELIDRVQADYVNFYDAPAVNPYVALAARGPWLVTTHGAVLHDSGGYGMLGSGHGPQPVLDAMAVPWVMANVMTPSLSHLRFAEALKAEVGHTRGACPFHRFLAMNSGSEAVTVASRIADIQAKRSTRKDQKVKLLALKGGFHGRTDRAAQASDSSLPKYRRHLRTFANRDNLITVPPNDVAALEAAFAKAREDGVYIEMMLVEPVMGEGNPGLAMTRAFYDAARRLTLEHGTLLLVDSIQAGLRATGHLSVVDYPGFQDAAPPDFETYSKALNAGQYPLSVLAMTERASSLYERGVYGNTMTTNPRALEVALTVLSGITPALRANIVARGEELVARLQALRVEFPDLVMSVQGTGLLVSAELAPSIPVVGYGGIEEHLRMHGMGVIHGGANALRFTPHFAITSAEIELMIGLLHDALEAFSVELEARAVSVPLSAPA